MDLVLVHTVQLKPMIKAHSSGRKPKEYIVIASVYSEKNPSEELYDDEYIMIIIIVNKLQEMNNLAFARS